MAKILVLGVTGMLGNAVFRVFSADQDHEVWGTMRSAQSLQHFRAYQHNRLLTGIDTQDMDALVAAVAKVRPDVLINCVGLIKHITEAGNPLVTLPVNAMLPHRLARLCDLGGARLIHVSTDCVFSGSKGMYVETDVSDAHDLYGKSKYIGELHDLPHAITLRTSIIGHELDSKNALLEWFLSQHGSVKGFRKARFSGLPTVELARVMKDFVLPNAKLCGLYHVAAEPISKFDLLGLIAKEYGKKIRIEPDDMLVIDRSLDGTRFRQATGYVAPSWPVLVRSMQNEC